jgi:hypothetical protein
MGQDPPFNGRSNPTRPYPNTGDLEKGIEAIQ